VASKRRTDVVPQNSQLTALRKSSQEVEEVIEKDSSSSSQRKRPTKSNPYATAAKFVDFAEIFKSHKASEIVAPHKGDPFCKAISKLGVKSLEHPAKAFVVCICYGPTYNDLVQYQEQCLSDSEHLETEQTLEFVPCARVFAARKDYFNHLKSSPSHDGNVTFAKALLELSRCQRR
jgi:hypothetical protein